MSVRKKIASLPTTGWSGGHELTGCLGVRVRRICLYRPSARHHGPVAQVQNVSLTLSTNAASLLTLRDLATPMPSARFFKIREYPDLW